MSRRADKRGRSKGGGKFVALPEFMLSTDAWRMASPVARAILIEVLRLFNGANNGRLAMSARDAADRVGCSKDTAARGLRELQEHGLLEQASAGYFSRRSPKATEWRVAWHRCDVSNALPSKSFLRWAPKNLEIRPTTGTARSDLRDSSAENHSLLSDHRDSKAGFVPSIRPTTGTHIDIYHGRGAGAEAQSAHDDANVVTLRRTGEPDDGSQAGTQRLRARRPA